jgi:hypothetical protein
MGIRQPLQFPLLSLITSPTTTLEGITMIKRNINDKHTIFRKNMNFH